jgi:DNA polymerase
MKLPETKVDTLVCVDFETYYDPKSGYTLSKMSTVEYVRSPLFQVIGVGVSVDDGPPMWMEEAAFRAWCRTVDWSHCAILAHNTLFDGLILATHYGVKPGFWFDTLCMGRALHGTEVGNSLKKLSSHYGVGEKGDEVIKAMGKRREHFTQADWLAYGEYCKQDVRLTRGLFERMSPLFPEEELWLMDTTERFYTEPGFLTDEPLLLTFLDEERKRKLELLDRIKKSLTEAPDIDPKVKAEFSADPKAALMSNDNFALVLQELGVDVPTKISLPRSKTASEKAGFPVEVETWAFSKADPGMQLLLEHDEDEVRWLTEARIGVKSTLNETRTERLIKLGEKGQFVPVALKYCGAHTGRWSGTDKMNFQNLPRGGVLRKSLISPPGYSFVVADSGQIEARVVAWLAGHNTLLDTFRRNDEKTALFKKTGQGEKGDVYADFATTVFGYKVTEATHPLERFAGKTALLGCGYGLGGWKFGMAVMSGNKPVQFKRADAEKFGVSVERWADERPYPNAPTNRERCMETPSRLPMDERLVHFAVAHHVVSLYREQNEPIPALWREMTEVITLMTYDNMDYQFGPGGCLRAVRHAIILPSGRRIRYPGLAKSKEGRGYSYLGGHGGKQREKCYGGSITENIVQALARDIVAEQLLRCRFLLESVGGRMLLMTHDENVGLSPDAHVEQMFGLFMGAMRTPSSWCADLPVNASGGFGKSYGAIK